MLCRCIQEAAMAGEKILTLRLDGRLRGKLDKLAAATRRSRSFLAAEAIRDYVALNIRVWRRRTEETLQARVK
jgi:predicted transcriptional regulator